MKCQVCGEIQTSRYLTYKDQPICEKDYKDIGHVCSMCDQIITGEVFSLAGRILCLNDYKAECEVQSKKCNKCGESVSPTEWLTLASLTFHPACLVCVVCHQNMDGKEITLDSQDRVYCTKDYTRQFSVVCSGCKKPIVPKKGQTKTQRMRALDKDYHLECFKCEDCGLVFKPGVKGKECWPFKKHLVCYKCYTLRQDECDSEPEE